ncbi:unnamed protein product [Gordionus sp. m RMFG-2023]
MGSQSSTIPNVEEDAMMPLEVFNLHIAVMQNDPKTVRNLGNLGVNLNSTWKNHKYPSVKDGTTALCQAISLNHKLVVNALLNLDVDINKCDSFGYTPLHKASYHSRYDLATILINKGANVHCKDLEGDTPLHICCKVGIIHPTINLTKMASLFIESRGGIILLNDKNKKGKTPLHLAAEWGLPHLVELLIQSGSRIDALDVSYRTPLHCCADTLLHYNSLSSRKLNLLAFANCVKIFLIKGCDPLNLSQMFFSHQSNSPLFFQKPIFYRPSCSTDSNGYLGDMIDSNSYGSSSYFNNNIANVDGNVDLNMSDESETIRSHNTFLNSILQPTQHSNVPLPMSCIRSFIEGHLKRSFKSSHSNLNNFIGINAIKKSHMLNPPLAHLMMNDPELWEVLSRHVPPSLRHSCRVLIRSRVNMTQDKFIIAVNKYFKIPTTLKEYLLRVPI